MERAAAGPPTVSFDGPDLAGGSDLCRMEAGASSATIKILLVKWTGPADTRRIKLSEE